MDCPSGRYSRSSTVYDFGIYWNRGIKKNTKEIIRVKVITYAVRKTKAQKIQACRERVRKL